jgi:sialic acid synthase SpsE
MIETNKLEINPLIVRGRSVIGAGLAPYVISEIGTNHNRDIETARELLRQTALAGCDCAKFQIYEPNEIVSETIRSKDYGLDNNYGDISAREMFGQYLQTPKEWFPELADLCHELKLDCCVTIHGEDGLRWADKQDVDIIKLASMDHTNIPFMTNLIGNIGKPILASFGMATLADIDAAVAVLREHPSGFALFHCVAVYPPKYEEMHLRNIPYLRDRYDLHVGFSDHTTDVTSCIAAATLGAVVFEKHLTLNNSQEGPDHGFALEPDEMECFVNNIHNAHRSLGAAEFSDPSYQEQTNARNYLKSIILKRDLGMGHKLSSEDVYLARPGTGIRPDRLIDVINNGILANDVKAEHPLLDEDLMPMSPK